jgi:glycosyltransferase involved in cell wall biosynthesis
LIPRLRPLRAQLRVGWATSASLVADRATFRGLETSVAMRIANVGHWVNRNLPVRSEMYRTDRRYDVVVFVKAMDENARQERERVQARGAKAVFDANVNYYEIWGDYELPNTRPTEEQRAAAIEMTEHVDAVVADSSYIHDIARKLNDRAVWIPDNVDLRLFRPTRRRRQAPATRLVWSGRAAKARPLQLLHELAGTLEGFELVVVSDREPAELTGLRDALPITFEAFDLRRYARILRTCDAIISPKRLVNGYEAGHTEWKITLGMAAALPAIASPQRSYVEALQGGGGIVADTREDWIAAFASLRDPDLRRELGGSARATVEERYSTPVVARRYGEFLLSL